MWEKTVVTNEEITIQLKSLYKIYICLEILQKKNLERKMRLMYSHKSLVNYSQTGQAWHVPARKAKVYIMFLHINMRVQIKSYTEEILLIIREVV